MSDIMSKPETSDRGKLKLDRPTRNLDFYLSQILSNSTQIFDQNLTLCNHMNKTSNVQLKITKL